MRQRWLILALVTLAAVVAGADEGRLTPEEQAPDLTLSVEKVLGVYVYWRNTDAGYENGYLEMRPDHSWTWVVHLDRDRDRVPDEFKVTRGTFAVGWTDGGSLGVWLAPESGEREWLEDLRIVGGTAESLQVFGRAMTRQRPGQVYFIDDYNEPVTAAALEVASDPPGAAVYIDGQRVAGTTPLTVPKPRAGQAVAIKVALPGYQVSEQTVTLQEGERKSLSVQLLQGEAGIHITSLPRVRVRLDGEFIGPTPVALEEVAAGTHRIELFNGALGISRTETVTLKKGEVWRKRFEFTGRLVIRTDRPCRVLRFGKSVGETPFDGAVPVGRHVLVLQDRDGDRRQLIVDVRLDETTTVDKPFDSLPRAD